MTRAWIFRWWVIIKLTAISSYVSLIRKPDASYHEWLAAIATLICIVLIVVLVLTKDDGT